MIRALFGILALLMLVRVQVAWSAEPREPLGAQNPKLGIGKEAPDIKGEDIDGKRFALSEYRGKVVELDFWGNW